MGRRQGQQASKKHGLSKGTLSTGMEQKPTESRALLSNSRWALEYTRMHQCAAEVWLERRLLVAAGSKQGIVR